MRRLCTLPLAFLLFAAGDSSSGSSPTVATDKADYGPFETVTITGSGFGSGEVLSVLVTAPDGSTRSGDGLGSAGPDLVTTDENGAFVLSYHLSGSLPDGGTYGGQEGDYTVTVINASGAVLARTTFSDGLGGNHSCALMTSGGVKCWGQNSSGQLGRGTVTSLEPTPADVKDVDGKELTGVVQISGGREHTCALMTSGGVKCWGRNHHGQLGRGTITFTGEPTPVDVKDVDGKELTGVVQISAGGSGDRAHTCALMTSGGVKCWGSNISGQLGVGITPDKPTPVDVNGLTSGVAQISAGGEHTCALMTSGGVKCWGSDSFGQLGDDEMLADKGTPVQVSGLTSGVAQISAGQPHTCAVMTSGAAKCWGFNNIGQLGDDSTVDKHTPVDVIDPENSFARITLGGQHTCALTTSGGAKCWGADHFGQLGNDSTFNIHKKTPVNVFGLTMGVAQISAGEQHTCALTTAGGAKCWGADGSGQLGNDSTLANKATPVDVSGLTAGVAALPDGIAILNYPPVANAGPDQMVECTSPAGASVMLDGSGSFDPDLAPLTFSWTSPSFPGMLTGATPTVTLPLGPPPHTITLEVSDGLLSSQDTVMVTVQDTTAPVLTLANASVTVQLAEGETTVAVDVLAASGATASDLCDPAPVITSNAPPQFKEGPTSVTIKATDAAGKFSEAPFTVEVLKPPNQPPVANAGPDQTVECTSDTVTPVMLDGSGSSDPDFDPLTFDWNTPAGPLTGNTPTVELPLGVHTITLVVKDGQGHSAQDTVVVTVQDTTAPVLTLAKSCVLVQLLPGSTSVLLDVLAASGAMATDTCDPSPVLAPQVMAFALGTKLVTITATDTSGNVAKQDFTVQVETKPRNPVPFTFTGTITEVNVECTAPAPFDSAVAGDTWKLTYSFDAATPDGDGSATRGLYLNPVTSVELAIGGASVSGPPDPIAGVPGDQRSSIVVDLATSGPADYRASMSLPDSSGLASVALIDDAGTPFCGDALPPKLPTPFKTKFPTARLFRLVETEPSGGIPGFGPFPVCLLGKVNFVPPLSLHTVQLQTAAAVDVMHGIITTPGGPAAGIYVVGEVDGVLPGETSAGGVDAFVQRYDLAGNLLWTDQFGSVEGEPDVAFGIASVPGLTAGIAVLVVGATEGTLPGQTRAGARDAFLRAYDAEGNVLFTKQYGTSAGDEARGICTTPDLVGNAPILVVGGTEGAFPGFTNAGESDAFLAAFDLSGNLQFVDQFGSREPDEAFGIQTTPSLTGAPSLFVAGVAGGDLPGLTGAGEDDAFLRAYDASGSPVWTRQIGSSLADAASSVGVTPPGTGPPSVFVGGQTAGALPGQTSFGGADAFLQRYDTNGNLVWTRQIGTAGDELNIIAHNSPAVFMAGGTTGAFPGFTNAGGVDVFYKKIGFDGNDVTTLQFGTNGDDLPFGIATSADFLSVLLAGGTTGAFAGARNPAGLMDGFWAELDSGTPLADLTLAAEIKAGQFEVKGTFSLGPDSDGIDPLTEDVTLTVGTFSTFIEAGRVAPAPAGGYVFEGTIDGVQLEVKIRAIEGSTFEFKAEALGADLSGTVNPVDVILSVGDDTGAASVTAEIGM